jgi:hypothetical protein
MLIRYRGCLGNVLEASADVSGDDACTGRRINEDI